MIAALIGISIVIVAIALVAGWHFGSQSASRRHLVATIRATQERDASIQRVRTVEAETDEAAQRAAKKAERERINAELEGPSLENAHDLIEEANKWGR